MGRAGAGDGEPAERGVELVELASAAQRVRDDRDAVVLALPGVDRRRPEVGVGQTVVLLEALHDLRGVVDRLVPRGEERDQRVVVGTIARAQCHGLAPATRRARR